MFLRLGLLFFSAKALLVSLFCFAFWGFFAVESRAWDPWCRPSRAVPRWSGGVRGQFADLEAEEVGGSGGEEDEGIDEAGG